MLHYNNSGNVNTIVLIHGFCENNTCFKQVLLLKDHFNVITIALPGHGKSPVIPSFSMEELADEIKAVLDKEDVKTCIMIGHSMGGYATLAFAKKHGQLLQGFGLLHSTAAADNDERKAKREQAVRVIGEKGAESYITGFIPPMFAPSTPAQLIDERILENKSIPAQGLISCLLAMKERPDSKDFLKETKLPVLFIVGKHDVLIPEKDMIGQAALCKQSSIVYLENSAHMGMLEEPEEVTGGIRTFALDCFNKK